MSAYRGHLTTVVGDGPEVVIKLSGNEVRVLTPDGRVHTWPSSDVRVTGISGDRFWIAFQGEIAVFAPEHPEEFMLEFLPGLKTARTVADAIAAANADRDDSDPHPEAFVATPIAETDDEEPPRVVAHRARLPQLSDHVAANGNGTTSDALASYRDPEPVEDEPAATGPTVVEPRTDSPALATRTKRHSCRSRGHHGRPHRGPTGGDDQCRCGASRTHRGRAVRGVIASQGPIRPLASSGRP